MKIHRPIGSRDKRVVTFDLIPRLGIGDTKELLTTPKLWEALTIFEVLEKHLVRLVKSSSRLLKHLTVDAFERLISLFHLCQLCLLFVLRDARFVFLVSFYLLCEKIIVQGVQSVGVIPELVMLIFIRI